MTAGRLTCPYCGREFPRWYWHVPNKAGSFGTKKNKGLALGNFRRHVAACQRARKDEEEQDAS